MNDVTDRLAAAFMGHLDHIDRALFGAARDEIERLRADFRDCYADLGETVIKLQATEAKLAEAVEVVREFHDAAQIDAVMEGPRLTGWNRSALNRAWPLATAFLAKLEVKP